MFEYRIAYGCWLNDSRLEPISDENWPSVRINDKTLASLEITTAFLKMAGYNYLDVFGLITNHSWKKSIASTISPLRQSLVKQVIEIVHRYGMKLIYGLGVYSWGFDQIIAQDSEVRGTNPQAMCASSEKSELVMHQVIDYLCNTYDLDGFHLEAADQGRCLCEKCQKFESDIDYYNHVNQLTASYIRNHWPEKKLLVNTSGYLAWGDVFNQQQLDKIIDLGKIIDVFIDVGSHGAFVAQKDRKNVISKMSASFGTSNGFWIYPPQRWSRLRWFIPHFQSNYQHLKTLYEDGGRSCELFLSPISNPGAELTQLCNGLFLQDPNRTAEDILLEAVDTLYQPKTPARQRQIADLFKQAESLFFSSWQKERNRALPEQYSDGVETLFSWSKTSPEAAIPGEFFLEPLFGVGPGFPCYLALHFNAQGRERYRKGMEKLIQQAKTLLAEKENQKIRDILTCCQNVVIDIHWVESELQKSGVSKHHNSP